MIRSLLLPALLAISTVAGMAQNLPKNSVLDIQTHHLYTDAQVVGGVYDESLLRTVELEFTQPNYWLLLTQNYASKTDIAATMKVDGQTFPNVGVRFKGNTSYMGTQGSQKKSFNITMDFQDSTQHWDGYQTLNFNNAFEDPSFMREVAYLHLLRRHLPAARASYIRLKINGQDWGLYPHVQQLNSEYLKEWFFSNDGTLWRADAPSGTGPGGPGGPGGPNWGDGTAGLNFLGTDTALYKKYYTLKRSEQPDPWQALVTLTQVLNQTPLDQLEAVIPEYLDLDRTLWFLAAEILFGDDDSYVYKGKMDYFLYRDAETGRMTPLEFDGNSCMVPNRITWSPFYNEAKVNYPLLNRLLAVPSIRQRYLAHFRTLIQDCFRPTVTHPLIDAYAAEIGKEVETDTKKLFTYAAYQNEINVLKNFFTNRTNFLLAHQDIAQPAPTVVSAEMQSTQGVWASPVDGEEALIKATVTSTNGISSVRVWWSDQLAGNFTPLAMHDDGLHQDNAAGDGVYAANLPAMSGGSWVRFYIEAAADNPSKTVTFLPAGAEHDVFIFQVAHPVSGTSDVVINELMADNETIAKDEAGVYEDWIELFNKGNAAVDLSGYTLSDKADDLKKWTFPAGTTLQPGNYLIVWADEDSAEAPMHANFRLSKSGETVFLSRPDGTVADQASFGAQQTDMGFARVPNGTGDFVIQTPTFQASNDLASEIDPATESQAWALHPNPANATLTLFAERPVDISVSDLHGRLVRQGLLQPGQAIDTSGWPSGLYVVQAEGRRSLQVVQH